MCSCTLSQREREREREIERQRMKERNRETTVQRVCLLLLVFSKYSIFILIIFFSPYDHIQYFALNEHYFSIGVVEGCSFPHSKAL